jgi:hypothetical protein
MLSSSCLEPVWPDATPARLSTLRRAALASALAIAPLSQGGPEHQGHEVPLSTGNWSVEGLGFLDESQFRYSIRTGRATRH